MHQIKQIPEDFIVKEVSKPEATNKEKSGNYLYFILKKRNYNTISAINMIRKHLNLPERFIGFAGNKDRNAITEQLISIKSVPKEKIERLNLKDIELKYIGSDSSPISLGDLEKNEFIISVRNLSKKNLEIFNKKSVDSKRLFIPNLFGSQRFSTNNAEIGKLIVKKEYKKAAGLVGDKNDKNTEDNENNQNNNPIEVLRKLPLKLRRIYIHAYQSLLWNQAAEEYIKNKKIDNIKIPIVGFGTEIEEIKDAELKKIIKNILEKEKLSPRDFIIKSIPELSSEGTERDLFLEVKDFRVLKQEKDELNKGKKKIIVSFSLPKGSYATVVIDYLFS